MADRIRTIRPTGQGGDFTTLAAWEASEQADLVSLGERRIAHIDGDWTGVADTAEVAIDGWTTDATNYVLIRASDAARHPGKWDATKYRLDCVYAGTAFFVNEMFTRIQQIQVRNSYAGHWSQTVSTGSGGAGGGGGFMRLEGCVVIANPNGNYIATVIGLDPIAQASGGSIIANNLIWNTQAYDDRSHGIVMGNHPNTDAMTVRIFNNTIIGGGTGIRNEDANVTLLCVNNILSGQTVNAFESLYGGVFTGSDYNATNRASGLGSANERVSQTFAFIDAANGNYRLSLSDTGARTFGTNLSADSVYPFATDINGTSRTGSWDIGAFEAAILTRAKKIRPTGQGGDYTSLSAWEAGEQADLVALDEVRIGQIEGDWSAVEDSAYLAINGWTTDATRYPEIRADTDNRAGSVWSDSKYRLVRNNGDWEGALVAITTAYLRITGIQIQASSISFAGHRAVMVGGHVMFPRFEGLHIRKGTSTYLGVGIEEDWYHSVGIFVNCIVANATVGFYFGGVNSGFTQYAYNCTAYGCDTGFSAVNSGLKIAKNCLAQNCTDGFVGTFDASSTNNCSDIASDAPGGNPRTGTVQFVNAAAGDFTLNQYDTVAQGKGISLYSDATYPVTVDIAGNPRGTAAATQYDIGASHQLYAIRVIAPSGGNYTSLASWEAAEQQDLVANRKRGFAEIGGDWSGGPDTAAVTIDGWTADAQYYIDIHTSGTARHAGKWDATKYVLSVETAWGGNAITVNENYVNVSGLLCEQRDSGFSTHAVYYVGGQYVVSDSIIARAKTPYVGSGFIFWHTSSFGCFRNCVAIGSGVADGFRFRWNWQVFAYNCTAYNCIKGFDDQDGAAIGAKNCLAQNCTDGFAGTFAASSTNNCSDIAADAPGANPITASVSFVDAANGDFTPVDTSYAIQFAGANLWNDATYPVQTDIAGNSRGGASAVFDLGAVHCLTYRRTIAPSGAHYTSLSAAESGEAHDLPANNKVCVLEIQGDWSGGPDTTAVTVDGWTTDATRFIEVRTVGAARHAGKWTTTAHRLELSDATGVSLLEDYVRVRGVQVKVSSTSTSSRQGFVASSASLYAVFDSCLSWGDVSGNSGVNTRGYSINGVVDLINCVCWNWVGSGGTTGVGFQITGGTVTLTNCTGYGNRINFGRSNGSCVTRNCGSAAPTPTGFSGSITQITNSTVTPTFVDPANGDFTLSPYDTTWQFGGTNYFAEGITTDIAGNSRGSTTAAYDIGASHALTSIRTIMPSGGNYTSLSAWEAAQQRDLPANNKIAVGEIDGTWASADTTTVTVDGWTTDATRYIEVRAVGTARHAGKWDATKYRITATVPFSVVENYVRVSGLQLETSDAATGDIITSMSAETCEVILDGLLMKGAGASTSIRGFRTNSTGGTQVHKISNSVVFNLSGTGTIGFWHRIGVCYVYNCTVSGPEIGFNVSSGRTIFAKNCLAQGCADGFGGSGSWTDATNNCSDIASDAPGSNPRTGTVSFIDSANGDFRLAPSDTVARGSGVNLSADATYPFDTDIGGDRRPSMLWDIGADAFWRNLFRTSFDGTESPLSEGGTWDNPASASLATFGKTSGEVFPDSVGDACARLVSPSIGADQYAQVVVRNISSGRVIPALRIQSNGDGYYPSADTTAVYLWVRQGNGSWYQASGSGLWTLVSGDVIRCEAEGTTIRVLKNGSLVTSWTDTAHASGQPGMTAYGSTSASADDFEAGDLPAASGPTPITGTGSVTQSAQTCSGAATHSAGNAIESSGSPTQSVQTSAGTAALLFSSSGTPTQSAQTSSGTAALVFSAVGAAAQAAQTCSGSASLRFVATGAVTQAAQTCAGSAAERFASSGSPTQAAQTAAGSAALVFSGSGSRSQTAQTGSGTASLVFSGSGSPTQSSQTGSGSATHTPAAGINGSGSPTQTAQTCAGSATYTPRAITSSGSPTQSVQTSTGSAAVAFAGSGSVTQSAQTSSGSASLVFGGSGAGVQSSQTASGSGSLSFLVIGTCMQSPQVVSGLAALVFVAAGSATQSSQTADGTAIYEEPTVFTGFGAVAQSSQMCSGSAVNTPPEVIWGGYRMRNGSFGTARSLRLGGSLASKRPTGSISTY
jgi:hypothetical protein